jgi:hypothetical protein
MMALSLGYFGRTVRIANLKFTLTLAYPGNCAIGTGTGNTVAIRLAAGMTWLKTAVKVSSFGSVTGRPETA